MKIIVGTRGSKLALTQTRWVVDALLERNPHVEFEIKIIKTKGDLIQNVPLDKIGDKGIFTKEIEEQLLNKEIDIAVHSMKDMPSLLPEGLMFSYVPKREDPRDILVLKKGYTCLDELPQGAKIGTGSKRRKYQLLRHRPDLQIMPIRGNVDTRIRKIEEENLDGIVLAAAGLHRIGYHDYVSQYLPIDIVLPAPAQGALALEIRENEPELQEILATIKDEGTQIQVRAERALLDALEGTCHIPMGGYCSIEGEKLKLIGLLGDEEGHQLVVKELMGAVGEEEELGRRLGELIRKELSAYGR